MDKNNVIHKVDAYNPDSDETLSERRIFGGNPPTDLNYNSIKYNWAVNLLEVFEKCTWFTNEVSLVQDKTDYDNLTKYEKEAYDKAFSQITMMDTFQTSNIMERVVPYVSAPEVRTLLARQAWEECIIKGHEVLTVDGWRDISDVNVGDEVMTFDKDTMELKFDYVTNVTMYSYDGELHHFDGDYVEQIVTSEHRMLSYNRNCESIVKKARELNGDLSGVFIPSFKTSNEVTVDKIMPHEGIFIGEVTKRIIKPESNVNVYCISVPSTFFVVRYNNKISVTGNCLHSKSYAVTASTISPNSDEVFVRYKTDNKLRAKNDKVAYIFNRLSKGEVTEGKFYLALIANQVLEGIFFRSAFVVFYSLALSGKMAGTATMINFIARDETNHLTLFRNMIKSTHRERPYLYEDKELRAEAMELITSAVELEIEWAHYITSNRVLGLSNDSMSAYVKYLACDICDKIGYDIPYPEVYANGDPLSWVKDFDPNAAKTNFFEGDVGDYSAGSIDFDDFG